MHLVDLNMLFSKLTRVLFWKVTSCHGWSIWGGLEDAQRRANARTSSRANARTNWKRGEVVFLLLSGAPPSASLLGRIACGALRNTTGPSGPGAPSPQPPSPSPQTCNFEYYVAYAVYYLLYRLFVLVRVRNEFGAQGSRWSSATCVGSV